MKKINIILAMLMMFSLGGISSVGADTVTMTNGNSTVLFDTATSAGMNSWTVDNIDMLYQQSFWYRIGNSSAEANISTLPVSYSVGNYLGGTNNLLTLSYNTNGNFTIDVVYTLLGGSANSGVSDIGEQIRIKNNGSSPLDFHFFQYSDFDLGGNANDTVLINDGSKVSVWDSLYAMSETVATPDASRWEANTFANTLNALEDMSATNLNMNKGPYTGDVTWAYQWDFTLNADGSYIISKDKRIGQVPEPATMILFGLGLIGLAGAGRKFKK